VAFLEERDPVSTKDKIKAITELADIVGALKKKGQRIVHCHGVFDLLHPGHMRHLQAAREQGDVLVVTVTGDRFVNKGPGRPVFNQQLRCETLAAIACVGYVAINDRTDAVEVIRTLRPDVYAKGADYIRAENDPTGMIGEEEQAILSVGGRIHFTDEIAFSSSQLINTHLDIFPAETESWLRSFRARRSREEILGYFDSASRLKALVIGEAIIDEYLFCEGLGKATKDPILAARFLSRESQAGGALAVANHVAALVGEVGLVAKLGELDPAEDFIRRHLAPNVTPFFVVSSNMPTIRKQRFVDSHTGARMIELYVMEDVEPTADDIATLTRTISRWAPDYDLVVVVDYGHGMMSPPAIEATMRSARFLAVNTQANAGNHGFNTVSRYRRADYVCLAQREVELEIRTRRADLQTQATLLASRIDCKRFTMTRGHYGSVHYDRDGELVEVPAFAVKVTDRIGAGDAVLAVTSPLVVVGAPWDIVGFIGNLAGAQMVTELGNRIHITRPALVKAINSMMR
jgi:rfaE bifunctional protein kinase chain/domain/rfaE bifunctional protein nucleotidyltransferase chain/domain